MKVIAEDARCEFRLKYATASRRGVDSAHRHLFKNRTLVSTLKWEGFIACHLGA
jgi:hypothetical protein